MNEYLSPLQIAQIKTTRPDATDNALKCHTGYLRAYHDMVERKKRIARQIRREDYLADLEIARRMGK